ncbi:hypothetical protein D3C78_1049480 [compost metagenome]
MQRRQQALLVAVRQALTPQRVVLVQQVDLGAVAVHPVEHLDAVGAAYRQHQRQVLLREGVAVQLQRAVARQVAAQVFHQCRQVGQAGVADPVRLQLQHMETLLDLQQEARHTGSTQQRLGFIEEFLHALGDGLGAIAAEAAHPQSGPSAIGRQGIEVVTQAGEQGVCALVAADQQLVPAVQADLVDGNHEVFTHPGVAQGVGAFGGQVLVLLAVLP